MNAIGETTAKRDRVLLLIALLFFACWLLSIGPVRTFAGEHGFRRHWVIGVAPNFFAGLTFAAWQAYRARTTPLLCVVYAIVVVTLAEAAQVFLPKYTADPLDALAGMVGALLAYPILWWRTPRSANA